MRSMFRSILAIATLIVPGAVRAQTGDVEMPGAVAQPITDRDEKAKERFLELLDDVQALSRWMTNEPAIVAVLDDLREQIAPASAVPALAPLWEFEPHFSHLEATVARIRVRLDPVQAPMELCDPARTEDLFLLVLDTLDAEGQREVIQRICEKLASHEEDPGRLPDVCFASHLAFLAARAMHDLAVVCDPALDPAKADGSAASFDQLRTDLAGVNLEVQESVRNARRELTQAMTVVAGHVSEVSSVNTSSLQSTIQQGIDHTLRLEIEKALEAGKSYGVVYLPEAYGGQLETVRRIVIDTIGKVRDSGETQNGAGAKLAAADEQFTKRHYKKAFRLYSEAYVAAIGIEEP